MIDWIPVIFVSAFCSHPPLGQSAFFFHSVGANSRSARVCNAPMPETNLLWPAMSRSQSKTERAELQERNLKFDTETRKRIEQTLADLGHPVGAVDGEFDQTTREAIKAFQEEWMFPVTGYIDDVTFGRLLAIGIIH